MSAYNSKKKAVKVALSLAMLALALPQFTPAHAASNIATSSSSAGFGDPIFERVWNHTDKPVQERVVARSWTWGSSPFYTSYEPYAEGPGGQHVVTYFDKSRMEINDPSADRNSQWFVTNGLLVVDMISGRIQTGEKMFAPASPAHIPVAGDASASTNAPTYAALAKVASLEGDKRAPNRSGQPINEYLTRTGSIGGFEGPAGGVRYGAYEPVLGHNIADVFWSFMNSKGVTYRDGQYVQDDRVVDWLFAMGYPITEPYWIEITVNGQEKWVLMQAFQRRVLTYSPDNPEGWKVEMGNVGRAYFDWRYNQAGQGAPSATPTSTPVRTSTPLPTSTATPTPLPRAGIAINPTQGNINTQITVAGKGFPAHAGVTVSAEKPGANYFKNITTVAARPDGSFEAKITLPTDAAQLDEITIVASANAGTIRATQTYRLSYSPSVSVAPDEVVANGSIRAQGEGFPAGVAISLGLLHTNGTTEWLTTTDADRGGYFNATLAIRQKPVGTQFRVVAATSSGFKATSPDVITVIAQPSARVQPDYGPTGVYVTFSGNAWPARRPLSIGIKVANSPSEGWFPATIASDAYGNFSTQVWIGSEYASYSEVRLIVAEGISTVRLEAPYFITRPPTSTPVVPPTATPTSPTATATATPVPQVPTLSVQPDALSVGQAATAMGSRWPAGATVSLGLARGSSGSAEESLGVARADERGNFNHSFALSARWKDAGQITLVASVPGMAPVTTQLRVISQGGRIVPAGLPMYVYSLGSRNGPLTFKARAEGWLPDSAVHINVVSVDGSINALVATATVKQDGTFNVAFNADPAWRGRNDLGVHSTAADGQQFSLRHLPFTDLTKVSGSGNTYQASGHNWPATTKVIAVLRVDGEPESEIGSATTDGVGQFTLQVNLPKTPAGAKNEIELRAADQPYSAWFDY